MASNYLDHEIHTVPQYKRHYHLELPNQLHEQMRYSGNKLWRLRTNLLQAATELGNYDSKTVECECCGRITYLPEFTPECLSKAWITIVRSRTGRLLYYCSRNCRRKHRGHSSNLNIIFKPEDAYVSNIN